MDRCPSCSGPLTGRTVRQTSPDDPIRARRKEIRELRQCETCGRPAWRLEGDTSSWTDGGPSLREHDYLFSALGPLPRLWAFIAHSETQAALDAQLRTEVADGHPLVGKTVAAIARCDRCDDVLYSVEEDPAWFTVVHLTWQSVPDRPPWPWSDPVSLPLAEGLLDHCH
ncbi:hypothetical protein LFM09_41185 [Lentzea alba]|uniref:hypothetical protein n=1 Tax=Lentzea alba TaxID=2714351 RepID=UPI0039BF3B3A